MYQYLIDKFMKIRDQYNEDCDANGGHDGTTRAFGLLEQMLLIQQILEEQYGVGIEVRKRV